MGPPRQVPVPAGLIAAQMEIMVEGACWRPFPSAENASGHAIRPATCADIPRFRAHGRIKRHLLLSESHLHASSGRKHYVNCIQPHT